MVTWERLVGHAQPRRGHATAAEKGLNNIGLSLYQWVDDKEYERWLQEHPDSSGDVMTISHVSKNEWEESEAALQ